jgi:DNA-binding XRE family transcriptional regulator
MNILIIEFYKLKNLVSCCARNVKEAGYSQENFATYVGIERGNYGKMERGCVNIKLETLYKLANALNCDFEEIMPSKLKHKITID